MPLITVNYNRKKGIFNTPAMQNIAELSVYTKIPIKELTKQIYKSNPNVFKIKGLDYEEIFSLLKNENRDFIIKFLKSLPNNLHELILLINKINLIKIIKWIKDIYPAIYVSVLTRYPSITKLVK